MVRRSQHLIEQGYYGPDGKPVVNYRENLQTVFKNRKVRSDLTVAAQEKTTSVQRILSGSFCLRVFLFVVFMYLSLATPCDSFSLRSAPQTVVYRATIGEDVHGATIKDSLVLKSQFTNTEKRRILPVEDSLWNFALGGMGAHVILSWTSKTAPRRVRSTSRGFEVRAPDSVLRGKGSALVPGEFWPMQGSSGQLFIVLPTHIHISHVTIGHITAEQSPSGGIPSAPKHFRVYGLSQYYGEEVLLGTFVYKENRGSFQMFEVSKHRDLAFKYVRLQVDSNHGNKPYTCLYSVRVHGDIPSDPTPSV
ncbi:unnamed protein product [Knipowitschia caucasica]|uniref:SUN domain-containing protein n=1 Tax=Knipowitschia caucasica TaxID=637954 RepID=A0AAV2MIE1_KNICA